MRDGWDFEGGVFGFASPDELRIEMGIVGVGLAEVTGGSVRGVTRPTGGLLMWVFDL